MSLGDFLFLHQVAYFSHRKKSYQTSHLRTIYDPKTSKLSRLKLKIKLIISLLARGFWESWRGIMIVLVVRRRHRRRRRRRRRRRSFVVRSFLVRWCNALSGPPMISLNGWRYEILVKTKKFRLNVKMCNSKKNRKKSFFWRFFSVNK